MRSASIILLTFATASLGLNIAKERRQDDLSSILAALEQTSPEDAAAAKTTGNTKRQDDLASILAALEQSSPEDAAAAKNSGASSQADKRQDDLASILAALQSTSPEDAVAASTAGKASSEKRQDDLSSILAALEQTSPDDAAAAKTSGSKTQKRNDIGDILVSLKRKEMKILSSADNDNNNDLNANMLHNRMPLARPAPTTPRRLMLLFPSREAGERFGNGHPRR